MNRLIAIRDRLVATQSPLAGEEIGLDQALGRYLAAVVTARVAAPPATCSAMDGFAVRSAEVTGPVELPFGAPIYAGALPPPLPAGQAARIFTGAMLPQGADAVVREESVVVAGDRVRFRAPARRDENVRQAGEDVAVGGEALAPGQRLEARQLALLLAVGVEQVEVVRRPRVAVISTGDEVVSRRTPDSNGLAVATLCRQLGAEVERLAVPDRLDEVVAALGAAARRSDAVLTIGGVSVGERDLTRAALAEAGARFDFWRVAMRPGKPLLFGRMGRTLVFGLPGNPASALVGFELFARPALRVLGGLPGSGRVVIRARLDAPQVKPAELAVYLRSRVVSRDGEPWVVAHRTQVSGDLTSSAEVGALALLPAGRGRLPRGSRVEVILLTPVDAG